MVVVMMLVNSCMTNTLERIWLLAIPRPARAVNLNLLAKLAGKVFAEQMEHIEIPLRQHGHSVHYPLMQFFIPAKL